MKQIKSGIWLIEAENKAHYPYSHSLYLEGKEPLIIDTGAGQALEDLAAKTAQVIISHYHRDHNTGNHLFAGALFSTHIEDAPGLESLEGFFRLSGLGQIEPEARRMITAQINFSATKIDRYLTDGDYLDLGNLKIRVIHLPGHTPGHCGFLIEEYGLIYASDIDLTGFGPWYGNPTSDLDQFRLSIHRLREMKPEILLTGHSMPITKNIDQKLSAYEAVIDKRDQAILTFLKRKPATLEQITDKKMIYRRHFGEEALRFFEENMIRKHLEGLLKRKMVTKAEGGLYLAV